VAQDLKTFYIWDLEYSVFPHIKTEQKRIAAIVNFPNEALMISGCGKFNLSVLGLQVKYHG